MRVAEFFAGIGLVRMALESHGFSVVWANDHDPAKRQLYLGQFGAEHFRHGDVRDVRGCDIPTVDLATASFPCTDLSLAGGRRGLAGGQSGLFWEFARVLNELGSRRPRAVLIENVPSFASANGGRDLAMAIERLNALGYSCDLVVLDARWFVPQSRPRLFIIGAQTWPSGHDDWGVSAIRPRWIVEFLRQHPGLRLHAVPLPLPAAAEHTLGDIVEPLPADSPRWWDADHLARFVAELSPRQLARFAGLRQGSQLGWATAYRRTRAGTPAWEIRADAISGCLRTTSGGSSRQALVEAGHGAARVRWMTGGEYAWLQGAATYRLADVPENRARFAFGDAVCVPVVEWLAEHYLRRLFITDATEASREVALVAA